MHYRGHQTRELWANARNRPVRVAQLGRTRACRAPEASRWRGRPAGRPWHRRRRVGRWHWVA